MLDALASLLAGVVFGLALAAPPGPMNAIIAEESVLRGWGAGFRAGLGAATADVVFFLLAALGVVTFVEQFPTVRGAMLAIGGVLMLYFASSAAREVRGSFLSMAALESRAPATDGGGGGGDGGDCGGSGDVAGGAGGAGGEGGVGGSSGRSGGTGDAGVAADSTGFRKAFVLALTNPFQLLFWLTIGVGLLERGAIDLFAITFLGDLLGGSLVVRTGSPAILLGFFGGIGAWITGFPAVLVGTERRVDAFAPAVAGLSALVLAGFGLVFLNEAVAILT